MGAIDTTRTDTIRLRLGQIVIENFLYGGAIECGENDSLMDVGILDSTGVVELVAHLEEAFGILVREPEMVPENLDSLAALTRYVGDKLGALSPGA